MKNLTPLFLALLFVVFSVTGCKNSSQPKTAQPSTEISSQTEKNLNESQSNDLFYKLMNAFSPDWIELENDPSIYPSFYGGSFIGEDGKFVIAVTENNEANRKKLAEMIDTDDFTLQTVNYSYAELLSIMNKIDDFLADSSIPNDHPALQNFAGAYPDVVDNKVRVTFIKLNDKVTQSFKKDVSNSPAIIFEQGNTPVLH